MTVKSCGGSKVGDRRYSLAMNSRQAPTRRSRSRTGTKQDRSTLRVSLEWELRIRHEQTAFRIAHNVSLKEQSLSKAPAGENSDWQGDNH